MEELDLEIKKQIENELGMTPEKLKRDLDAIRNWVNKQPHLPELKDDEETNKWLYNLLFYSKNRIEKVKKHLDVYYTCKSQLPEFYGNRDPESKEIRNNVKALYLFTVPKLTPKGYRVRVFCQAASDPSLYEPVDFMRRALMTCDLAMTKDDVSAGEIIIFYLKYSSLAHFARYSLAILSKFIATVLNAYPLRIKAIHCTHAPSFVSYVMSNPFLTEKVKKKMKIHTGNNIDGVFEDVPEYCLPKELGGSLDVTLQELNNQSYEKLLEHRDWFLSTEKYKSDESKRPSEMKKNDLFGCEGTFRTLAID